MRSWGTAQVTHSSIIFADPAGVGCRANVYTRRPLRRCPFKEKTWQMNWRLEGLAFQSSNQPTDDQ